MSLTLDKLEMITDYKHLQIREIDNSGEYHRRVLTSDMTLAEDEHEKVKDMAESEWTDEVKAAWVTYQEELAEKFD